MKLIQSRRIKYTALFLLLALLAFGLLWVNYKLVQNDNSVNEYRGYYLGTRAFILEGVSPYSDTVLDSVQMVAEGRESAIEIDQIRFSAPLYSVVLFAPFSILDDFHISRAIWIFMLQSSMIGLVFALLEVFRWKPAVNRNAALIFLSVSWFYSTRVLSNGSPIVIAVLAFFLALLFLIQEQDELAGFFLAIALIKPEILILPVSFVLFWIARKRRSRILLWFVISLGLMIIISMVFIRDWIPQYLGEIIRSLSLGNQIGLGDSLSVFFPGIGYQIKWLVGIGITALVVFEIFRSIEHGVKHFIWCAVFVLTINQWIGIGSRIDRFYAMIPGIVLVLASVGLRWVKHGDLAALGIMAAMVLISWGVGGLGIQRSRNQILVAIEVIAIPAMITIGLYWTKWWFTTATNPFWETTK
jgi:hypothetical protein